MNAAVLETPQTQKKRREAQNIRGKERFAIWLGSWLVWAWTRSLRLHADEQTRAVLSERLTGVHMLWHNRLFMISEVGRRYMKYPGRNFYGLISGSKDGAWLSGIFSKLDIEPIRGSSSWRGTEALREIVRLLRDGNDVGITPDGPRGPCYSVQRGALVAARSAGVAITLTAVNPAHTWRLKSWDRFYLPVPFSRIEVRSIKFKNFAELERAAGGEDPAAYIRRRLLELSGIDESEVDAGNA
ncbi:MAG: lysophospholipid acyltransferase family protein [Puniceicoccales bacterium]